MRTKGSELVVLTCATLGFVALYLLNPPAPLYDVKTHVWTMQVPPGEPYIGWYGRLAWSMLGAALAALPALAVRRRAWTDHRLVVWACLGLTVSLMLAFMVVMIRHEGRRWMGW